jgi:V8-like Glu-specific endopeptidase
MLSMTKRPAPAGFLFAKNREKSRSVRAIAAIVVDLVADGYNRENNLTNDGKFMKCRNGLLLSAAVFSLALPACKKAHEVNRTAYIVGPTNDIKKMGDSERREVPAGVYNASVLIATQLKDKKIKFCSGTLLAGAGVSEPNRILTNHHCFARQDGEGKAVDELIDEACTGTKVYFGYYAGEASAAASVPCQQGSLRTNFDGDLAVFNLAENPKPPHVPLQLWDGDSVPEGRKAYIVHYPDVSENLEPIAPGAARLPVAAVTIQDCKVAGPFDPAEWDLDRTLPYSIRHTCDLIHGSSGSALVDAQTSTMIGVNWGGIKITYDSGTRVDNVATRIDFVRAFLDNREGSYILAQKNRRVSGGDNAVAGTLPQDGSNKKESAASERRRKSVCGAVSALPDQAAQSSVLTLLFLILPFIVPVTVQLAKKESQCVEPLKRR